MSYRSRMAYYLESKGKIRPKESDTWEEMENNSPDMPEQGIEGADSGGSPLYERNNLASDEGYKYPPQALAYGGQAHGHPMSHEMYSVGAQKMMEEAMPHLAQGGQAKLGSGKRFEHLTHQLAGKGADDPKALAAYIGRKKYGAHKMGQLAAKGHARGGMVHQKLAQALMKRR